MSTNDTSKVKDYSLKWVAVLDVKYKNPISTAANYEFPFTVTIKNCKTTTISISNIPSQTAYTYSINPTLLNQQTYLMPTYTAVGGPSLGCPAATLTYSLQTDSVVDLSTFI